MEYYSFATHLSPSALREQREKIFYEWTRFPFVENANYKIFWQGKDGPREGGPAKVILTFDKKQDDNWFFHTNGFGDFRVFRSAAGETPILIGAFTDNRTILPREINFIPTRMTGGARKSRRRFFSRRRRSSRKRS